LYQDEVVHQLLQSSNQVLVCALRLELDLFEFDPRNRRAGLGILIADRADRGKGFATEALHLVVEYAFQVLDLHQLYSNVRVDNESSVALFKKMGFEITGLKQDWVYDHGRYHDEYTMQLIRK